MHYPNKNGWGHPRNRLLAALKYGLLSLTLLLPLLITRQPVEGAPSATMNFQARLLNSSGSIVADGNYHVEFKLYNAASGGSALWTETRTTGNLVSVKSGYLSVYLGSVNAFPSNIDWNDEHWLTMNIGGASGSPTWDGEMSPRIKMTAVPYAFQAGTLAKTSGSDRGTLSFGSVANNPQITLPDATGVVCLNSGNCGYGTGDILNNGQAGPITIGTNDNTSLFLETNDTNRIEIQGDGDIQFGSTSGMFFDATNNRLSIGSNNPASNMLRITVNDPNARGLFITAANGQAVSLVDIRSWAASGAAQPDLFRLQSNGNLQIGGTFGSFAQSAAATNSTDLQILSGNVTGAGSNSGSVSLVSGNATSGNSGSITIDSGTASGSTGAINIGTTNASAITIGRSGITTTLPGALAVQTLGTASNDSVLCRNGSNQLATCNSTFVTSSTGYIQEGNSFGATAVLGTNDSYGLAFETDNVTRLSIDTSGNATLTGNLTVDTNTFFVDAVNNRVGIGTTTPSTTFDVQGSGSFSDRLQIGSSNTIDECTQDLISIATCDIALEVVNTSTESTNVTKGASFVTVLNASATNTAANVGTESVLVLGGSQNFTNTNRGAIAVAGSLSSGVVSDAAGMYAAVSNAGSGIITNAKAIQGGVTALAGSIGNAYGLFIESASGSIGDNFGAYILNQTAGTNNYGLYIQGASTYALWVDSGVTRLDGTLELGTLGTASNDSVLCRNGSNQLATCNSTFVTSSTGYIQGGNSFGATAVLGTNDSYGLAFETDNVTRLSIDTSGNATLTGNLTVQGTGTSSFGGTLTVEGDTTLGNASSDTLTITGTAVTLPNNLNFDSNTLYIDSANNRVGMGIATPDEQLHVVGNIKAVGSMALGNGSTGAVSAGTALRVIHTIDAASDAFTCVFGCYAMSLNATIDNSNSAISGLGVGLFSQVSTANRNFTLLQANGLRVNPTALGAGSTITDNYGIYVANQTAGTNDYGIYVAGADTNALWIDAGATRLDGVTTIGTGLTSGVALTVNNGTSTSNILNVQDNGTNVLSVADGGNIGIKTGANAPTADLTFGDGANRTINVLTRTTTGAGYNLSVVAGGGNGSGSAGGVLNLQGGNAGSGNAHGGNVLLTGGTGVGTGAQGLVVIGTPTFQAASVQNFTGSGSITQANIDGNGSILVSSNAAGYTITLGDPTITTAGRVVYVTNSGLFDMTLSVNGGGTGNVVTLKPNTTATMLWNGSDWTAAGASSSTDLQAAYNNTATSAGGAELVLNAPGGAADGFTIRNNPNTPISGGILEVQSSIGTNLFSVNNRGTELAANGGAETSGTFATNWSAAPAGGSVTRTTTAGQFVTGQAGVQIATSGANHGVRNNLSSSPATSTTYTVSFTAKASVAISSNNLNVQYSRDGGSDLEACTSYSSQNVSTSVWTKITCTITTDSTTATNPDLIIRQADGTSRNIWIDNLSFIRNDSTTQPSNVQIGGGIDGGPITLFTLDRATSPPVADGDSTYLGSMYYDMTTGRIQCYESDGWGACGSAPDNIITLTPEYTGAVLNGSGIGTMTADFCSNDTALSVNTSFCASGISRNYYRWTSPQATQQTYSIYVSYKLPNTFKSFQDGSTIRLTALSDNTTNGVVDYEVFRSTGSAVTSCGSQTTVTTSDNTWQTVSFAGDETACGFSGGNYIIFKINVRAQSNANVYVENLDFTYLNQ